MPTSLIARALVTVEEAKEHLEIPGSDLSRDQAILTAINAATGALESITSGPLVYRAFTGDRYTGSRHDGRWAPRDPWTTTEFGGIGRSKFLYLRQYPIVSVQAIADESVPPITILAADYYIRPKQGILEHFTVWPMPYHGNQVGEWVIDFTAGWFVNTAAVEWDAKAACLLTVAEFLQRKSGSIQAISSGSLSVSFAAAASAVPEQARQLIGRYKIGRI